MKISPILAKMLNDVECQQYEDLTDEQAANLSAEIEAVQAELTESTKDASVISEGIEDIEAAKADLEVGLQSDIDYVSAKLLMSNLNAAIKKLDSTATIEIAGLQSDNKNAILTAGLQAADGILAKALEGLKKLWEKIKAGFKWFMSKIKELVAVLFSPFVKILKKQRGSKFAILSIKEAEDFYNSNKKDLESNDPETIEKLKKNFLEKVRDVKSMIYGLDPKDAESEIETFIAQSPFGKDNAGFVNFILNIYTIKKNIESSLNIEAGNSSDRMSNIFLPISRSIFEFAILDMIAENKNSENIKTFLQKNEIEYLDEALALNSESNNEKEKRMTSALETAIGKKVDDICKNKLPAIISGDAIDYINKLPILIDKTIDVYKDTETIALKLAGDTTTARELALGSLDLKSDSFVFTGLNQDPLSITRTLSVDYINLFSSGWIHVDNTSVDVTLTFDQLLRAAQSKTKPIKESDITKQINDSLGRLEKSYKQALSAVDTYLYAVAKDYDRRVESHGQKDSMASKTFSTKVSISSLISNLSKLSPAKGIGHFAGLSSGYKEITKLFNIEERIREEFERLADIKRFL